MKGEIREMAKKLKKLKLYGLMYLAFGVINAISTLWGLVKGRYSALMLVESESITEGNALFFEVFAFAVATAVILGYLCIGVKGYIYGIGEGYGMIHISVSKYLLYALVLDILVNIWGCFIGQVDFISVVTSIIGLYYFFDYKKCARVALES